ncbi:NeuD/PglB/VioB family sugar acetyltransferase [Luteibacter sp. 329MFSha]|uniref:NeuD/PglB/VioB family sugar acetyltransferase n=1 Tax=Luteibacter sp. 329MFSha TaxID=1798239 RepID=UPI0008BA011F|nr:NeuD/PglB/VioB family sugar acetyltransferase [Luteibacter sp. 329MFSha]SEW01803.1 sugar O-acyltransferase, sialic acid O-acetyltransferase NeuD family [Luteibacter sp. 329MFSha]
MPSSPRNASPRASLPDSLAIIGAGGHGREIAWLAQRVGVPAARIVFAVHERYLRDETIDGMPVHSIESGHCDGWPCVVAIGDPRVREALTDECVARRMRPATLIHPGIDLHESVSVGEGVVMAAGVVVTVNVSIGDYAHINVGASVSHDCVIGRGATISPGARLAGHVHVGRYAFLGLGCNIVNGTESAPLVIGDDAVVGAGACVIRSVDPGATVIGVPARPK